MEYKKSKNHILHRASAISVLLVAVFVLALVLALIPTDIASAVLPQSYVNYVDNLSGCEWWMGEKFLDIAKLKKSVDGWRSEFVYDFEALEKNPVRVAVIDNGMLTSHSLFSGKYNAQGSRYDENGNLVVTDGIGDYDIFLRDDKGNIISKNDVSDSIIDKKGMHGSHVAGILAILIHSLDLEKYIKIIPIKAADGDTFYSDNFKNAVAFALDNEADVVNMSLSAKTVNSYEYDISKSQAERAVFVCAAGNYGKSSNSAKYYPAASPNVIGVMNYQSVGGIPVLSSTSNYGSAYDICAPGTAIYSVNGNGTNDSYIGSSGTSMASPIVAFAAALATLKYRALGEEKTKIEIADIVRNLSTSTLTHKGESFKTLDLNLLAKKTDSDFSAEIRLKNENLAVQQLGRIKGVEMSLAVSPSEYQGEGTVEWLVGEQKIGQGFNCTYTPPSTVGEVTVKAIWTHPTLENAGNGNKTVVAIYKLKVEYLKIDGDTAHLLEVNITTSDGAPYEGSVFHMNNEYVFSVDTELLSPNDAQKLMWYVNDKFVSVVGSKYNFTPQSAGRYVVEVKINGVTVPVADITVKDGYSVANEKTEKGLMIYTIIAVALIDVAAICVLIVIIVKRRSKRAHAEMYNDDGRNF